MTAPSASLARAPTRACGGSRRRSPTSISRATARSAARAGRAGARGRRRALGPPARGRRAARSPVGRRAVRRVVRRAASPRRRRLMAVAVDARARRRADQLRPHRDPGREPPPGAGLGRTTYFEQAVPPEPWEHAVRNPIRTGPDGSARVPDGPGLGIELDEAALERATIARVVAGSAVRDVSDAPHRTRGGIDAVRRTTGDRDGSLPRHRPGDRRRLPRRGRTGPGHRRARGGARADARRASHADRLAVHTADLADADQVRDDRAGGRRPAGRGRRPREQRGAPARSTRARRHGRRLRRDVRRERARPDAADAGRGPSVDRARHARARS